MLRDFFILFNKLMTYESFKNDNPNCARYLTIDGCLSCLAITVYVGFMSFLTYKFIKDYGLG